MRKLLLSAAMCVAMTSGSAKAENFSGPFAGVQAGYAWGSFNEKGELSDGITTLSFKDKTSVNGLEGGIYAGYRAAIVNDFILSGEIGYLRSGSDGSNSDWITTGSGLSSKIEKRDELYLSLKPGFKVTNDSLVYGIFGGQVSNGKATVSDDGTGESESDSSRFRGFHIGAGAEIVTAQNISLRLEYKYQDYAAKSYSFTDGADTASWKGDLDESVVRVGLTYNF